MKNLIKLTIFALLIAGIAYADNPENTVLAITNGMIIDGYGGPPIHHGTVLIQNGKIIAIGPSSSISIPEHARILDASGKTVMPGLIDMHVHLTILGHADYAWWDTHTRKRWADEIMPIAARQLLMAGVTTARDVGAPLEDSLIIRERIKNNSIPGPHLFVSGPFLQVRETIADHEHDYRWAIRSPQHAREIVTRLARAGVDLIKLIDQDRMEQATVDAIVETAHIHGLHVAAHAHREDEIRKGLKAGVDDFEHTGLGTAPGYPDDILQALANRNASLYWTPTISPLYLFQETVAFPERLDDPRLKATLPPDLYARIHESLKNYPALPYFALIPRRIPTLKKKFHQLLNSGVTLLIGTDSGIPGLYHFDSTWREMWIWQKLGVRPMTIIQAATYWPARLLKQPDIGTLAPGHHADIIIVNGNPLEDMRDLRNIDYVIKDGQIWVEEGKWVGKP